MCPGVCVPGYVSRGMCPGVCVPGYVSRGVCPGVCVPGYVSRGMCPGVSMCLQNHIDTESRVCHNVITAYNIMEVATTYIYIRNNCHMY
jgi:hypothetical protein